MKRASLLILALVLACAACAPVSEPSFTPVPTLEATAAPTEASTPAPTDTPAPTEAPDFSAFLPRTGRLVDGPIFPEPFKYLVLLGDSNLHYVYNNMGELLYTFAALVNMDEGSHAGLFTADGISSWHRLSDGAEVTPFMMFGDMAITVTYVEDPDSWAGSYACITLLRDRALENPVEFDEGEMRIGNMGGLLKIDGGYILVDRGYGSFSKYFYWDLDEEDDQRLTRYDESFRRVGRLDASRFGYVRGVFGGRYMIGFLPSEDGEEWDDGVYSIYTLDGELVMENIEPYRQGVSAYFCIEDELWESGLIMTDYIKGADGIYYDKDLNPVDESELPKYHSVMELASQPYCYSGSWDAGEDGVKIWNSGVYSGLMDADGRWVFRVYCPKFAEDTIPECGGGIGNYWPDD